MNPFLIDIESPEIETRKGKNGDYVVQIAYAHTVQRDGSPKRYPEQFAIFPPKDRDGTPIPYKPGKYMLDPRTFRVSNGFLEMGFAQLTPVHKAS